jgi:hypothetical protein
LSAPAVDRAKTGPAAGEHDLGPTIDDGGVGQTAGSDGIVVLVAWPPARVALPPLLMTVFKATPPDSTSSRLPPLTVMPLLVTPEVTLVVVMAVEPSQKMVRLKRTGTGHLPLPWTRDEHTRMT